MAKRKRKPIKVFLLEDNGDVKDIKTNKRLSQLKIELKKEEKKENYEKCKEIFDTINKMQEYKDFITKPPKRKTKRKPKNK